jgi:hypothetical protein
MNWGSSDASWTPTVNRTPNARAVDEAAHSEDVKGE